MMTKEEREAVIAAMWKASNAFYASARNIGNHPFIEFSGIIAEYIKCCENAHRVEIDFTECNAHSGKPLPVLPYQMDYINEKLDCIFTGSSFGKEPEPE